MNALIEQEKIMRTAVGQHLCILQKNGAIILILVMKLERALTIIYVFVRSVLEKKARTKRTRTKAKEVTSKVYSRVTNH